jgi:hypothetical protein
MLRGKLQVFCVLVIFGLVCSACGSVEPGSAAPDAALPEAEDSAAQPVSADDAMAASAESDVDDADDLITLWPQDPPEAERTLKDSDSSLRAYEKRTLGVDEYLDGLYERPFTAREMDYLPHVDIITVDFAADDDFFYFTIRLYGMDPLDWGLTGAYGIEFDRKQNGRGELLVLAQDPGAEWSLEGVRVFADSNGDVGGPKPMIADAGFQGNGYETQLEMAEERTAFARSDPQQAESIQLAVSRQLLDDPQEFLWSAWAIADLDTFGVALFDFNDRMGPSAAGSPLRDDANYPIKELFGMDNTCRLPYGLPQSGNIPGMCKVGTTITEDGGGGKSCPPGTVYLCIDGVCFCYDPTQT